MKRKIALYLIACLILVMGIGCSGENNGNSNADASAPSGTQYLSIGTGGVTGVYYPLGGTIANLISNNIEGYDCTAESTGGAVENAKLIASDKTELGFLAASTLYDIQYGVNAFEGEQSDQVLGVFSFYPEVVQIVSTDPSIQTVADMKGKRVAIGSAGSGTATMTPDVLEVYGMTLDDIRGDNLGFGDAVDGLKDGNIDAAFTWAGIPTANILDLGAQHDISLITFSDEELEKLQNKFPYAVPARITSDIYPSLLVDAQTFSIPAVIACSSDLSEEFVYDLLTVVFDNLDSLAQTHERGGDLKLETALDGFDGIKLHPGAERFYKEKGILE